MTRLRPTPPFLRELLGAQFSVLAVASMLALGAAAAGTVLAVSPPLPGWRLGLAAALIADIGAGALANFTSSTNDWYGVRPRHRWVFIAAHVHLPVVAFLLDWPWPHALLVWGWTIASATVVNLLATSPVQRPVAGGLLAASLLLQVVTPTSPAAAAISALFTLKVAYAFAVRHSAPGAST